MLNSYRKLCTEFYDTDKPTAPADALAFYRRYAEEADGPILEPMCGSGRFLVPLAEAGFDIDGSDASPDMLDACRRKCETLGLVPHLSEQFLDRLDVSRRYALIFIPSGSFGLITDPQSARESLRRIHDAMLPGAKFVFEVPFRTLTESCSWPWGGRWIDRADGARLIISWMGRYDADERVSHSINRYELVKDGKLMDTEFEYFDLRSYDCAEISALLQEANFTEIKASADYTGTPVADAGDGIIIECSKS